MAIAGSAAFLPSFPSVCGYQALSSARHSWNTSKQFNPAHRVFLHCSPSPAAALRTPKAALRTHGFLLAQHRAVEHTLELTTGEIDLCTQPIFVLANLASGVTSLIPDTDLRRPEAIHPAPVVAQIQTHHATRAAASPAFCERLVEYCLEHGVTLPTLTKVFTGGGPVSPHLLDRLQQIAPQATITAVYGSTEAEPIALVARHEIAAQDIAAMLGGRGLLAGRPVPIIQLRILKKQLAGPIGPYTSTGFDEACQPAGEPGEIVVNGEHVLSEYLNGCCDEENKFNVAGARWHRTGDAGYLDDRGRLWLLGRCSACIEDCHGTLYPFSVEHAALQHDCVRRAAAASIRANACSPSKLATDNCRNRAWHNCWNHSDSHTCERCAL